MSDSVERLLVRIDATTEVLRRELKAADKAMTDSASIVEKAQARMNNAWAGANKYVNQHQTELKLLGAAAVGATALAVNSIIKYTDSYQRLQGQLRLVTNSQDELNRVYDGTKRIASETGQTLESTITLYARMSRATEQMGLSEKERLEITDTINKSLIVSGTSAQEAAGSLRQLSQALASGVLRGEEFNSMSENAPRLLKGIADSLGVTIGELRAMSKEGELTSDVVIKAFQDMKGEVDSEFSKMPMTVERAMNRISVVMQDAIGKADMSPLIDNIQAFEEAINDPDIISGLTATAGAIVDLTVKAAQAVAALSGMAKATGEWVASLVAGSAADDIVAQFERIAELQSLIAKREASGWTKDGRYAELKAELKELEAAYALNIELINQSAAAREKEGKATGEQASATLGLSNIIVSAKKRESTVLAAYQKTQDKLRVTTDKLAATERQRVDKVADTTKALDRQLAAIKMTDRAQVIYNATMDAAEYAHGEELAAIVDKTVALYDQRTAIEAAGEETQRAAAAAQQAAEESAQAAQDAMQPWNDALQDMAANIDQGFSQAWTDAFSGAEDGFKSFADNMKNAFLNLLGNMAHMALTRPIVMQISAAMGGLMPGAASAGIPGVTGGGGFSNLFGGFSSGVSGMYGSAASGLRGIGLDSAANFADAQAGIYGQGGWTAAGYGALNMGAGFLGNLAGNQVFGETSGIGSAVGGMAGSVFGPLGTAAGSFIGAGIEKALDKVFGQKNDGNNSGASDFNLADRTNVGRTWGKSPGPENADAAVALAAGLQQFADAIGGSSLAANITVGNRDGIKYNNQSFGQDAEAFYDVAFKDVIRNATGLNDALKDLALAFEGTAEETATYIMAMSNMAEAVQTNPVEQAMKDIVTAMDEGSSGMLGAYYKQIDGLNALIDNYDGSAGATVELNDALVASRQSAYELAVAIVGMSEAIGDMLGSQSKSFREDIMTPEELTAVKTARRTEIMTALETATDPQQVFDLVTEFTSINKDLWDGLTDAQKVSQIDTFTGMADKVDLVAQSILGTALTDLQGSQEDINDKLITDVLGAAATIQKASDDMGGHVNTFGDYVQQLVTRGIRIVVNDQSVEVAA